MNQTLQPELYGLANMDANTLNATEGGVHCPCFYSYSKILDWGIRYFNAFADGASQSAHDMPGLK